MTVNYLILVMPKGTQLQLCTTKKTLHQRQNGFFNSITNHFLLFHHSFHRFSLFGCEFKEINAGFDI